MLILTHRYRIYPDSAQKQQLIEWMEICRGAFNYALREIKDWCDSRKCLIDRCSIEKEYILSPELKFPNEIQQLNNLPKAKKEFPRLSEVPSQVLQQAIKQRFHHQIDNTRKDFHYKQAHALCDAGDMVFMEDLDYSISAKGMFGKQMLDAAFGQFRSIVKYVCWKRGKFFAEVDARGTSQECPECGEEVKKNLKIRIHDCINCGYKTDRDIAAASNIRNRGIKLISTVGQTGMETACADDLPGAGENQSRQVSQSRSLRVTRKSKK